MHLAELSAVAHAVPVHELSEAQVRELQTALSRLGYPVGEIDGLVGPRTRNAWAEFKTDIFRGNPELVGAESLQVLQERVQQVALGRGYDFATKEGTIAAIRDACRRHGIGLPTQTAYVLATTEWETAQTFQPVREAFWLSENWRREHLRYYPYYGRGYVQLTWETNYRKYGQILGLDLVGQPDLAMDPDVALFVLVHGFKTGTFTGRAITDYIDAQRTDFVGARRCINGRDHAHDIAQLAEAYLQAPVPA